MTLIQSPLNYTGGKFKLLKQILPLFPKDVKTFVDLFCGGANVGVNAQCQRVLFNDIDEKVVRLLETLRDMDSSVVFETIDKIVTRYGLSDTMHFSYEHYGCDSSAGLSKYNKVPFLRLRNDFNRLTQRDNHYYYLLLYALIVFSFNNQIRFNSKGEFNLPVGKRDFNLRMRNKLDAFIKKLHSLDCSFLHVDFTDFELKKLSGQDFVYADPPYLITCATYNENNGWNGQKELDLLAFLDHANQLGVRFALSNVLAAKGKRNEVLSHWLHERVYCCHHLDYNYRNSNYHIKDRASASDEVLITNYAL